MLFYQANLGLFVAANTYLVWSQHRETRRKHIAAPSLSSDQDGVEDGEKGEKGEQGVQSNTQAQKFQLDFFLPYTLATAADWLQVSDLSLEICECNIFNSQTNERRGRTYTHYTSMRNISRRKWSLPYTLLGSYLVV